MTSLRPRINKGRNPAPLVGDEPFHVADFNGYTVSASQHPCRFFITYDLSASEPSHPQNKGFLLFKDALQTLADHTHYRSVQSKPSLLHDLMSDWEPAHIFIALNLPQLEQYAKGEWVHFHDPSYCCWLAMEASHRYGKPCY